MKSISSESKRDRRLAAIAFLRDSHVQNLERLSHVNQILNGTPSSITNTDFSVPESTVPQRAEASFWRSFRMHFTCSLILTIFLYLAMMTSSPNITYYLHMIKAAVVTDYSENLFDFFYQIPYTLEYEKINAEG